MPRPCSSSLWSAPRSSATPVDYMPRVSCPPTMKAPTTASLANIQMLHKISHVQLLDFQKIDGVKYYVLNVYEKSSVRRANGSGPMSQMRRLSDFASTAESSVTVESSSAVAVKRKPAYRVVKRFSDFEELRKLIKCCFKGSKRTGECSCCDAFTTFLSCRSMQPGLFVKLTKREAERKVILEQFINQVIRLTVMESRHYDGAASCCVKEQVPTLLHEFMHATTQHKARKHMPNDDFTMTA